MDSPNEQQLYHSIATLATLLLQIGDVGKQFYLKVSKFKFTYFEPAFLQYWKQDIQLQCLEDSIT